MIQEGLSSLASCAAIEIDNLTLERSTGLDSVRGLATFLEEKIKGKEMRQTLALLVWQTMSEEDQKRTRTVSEVATHVEEVVARLRRVVSINPGASDELSNLRDFCVMMSKQSLVYDFQSRDRYR